MQRAQEDFVEAVVAGRHLHEHGAVPVPIGFSDMSLTVPRPNGTLLYLKLRDDPATVDMAVLPVLPEE